MYSITEQLSQFFLARKEQHASRDYFVLAARYADWATRIARHHFSKAYLLDWALEEWWLAERRAFTKQELLMTCVMQEIYQAISLL